MTIHDFRPMSSSGALVAFQARIVLSFTRINGTSQKSIASFQTCLLFKYFLLFSFVALWICRFHSRDGRDRREADSRHQHAGGNEGEWHVVVKKRINERIQVTQVLHHVVAFKKIKTRF